MQYLIEQFWTRWKREYLQHLQARAKWNKPKRNLRVGDIVLSKDPDLPRNEWKLARVIEAKHSMTLSTSLARTRKPMELERPVHKLVLLLESETG